MSEIKDLIEYPVGTQLTEAEARMYAYGAGRQFCSTCKKITYHKEAYDPSNVPKPRTIEWCEECRIVTTNRMLQENKMIIFTWLFKLWWFLNRAWHARSNEYCSKETVNHYRVRDQDKRMKKIEKFELNLLIESLEDFIEAKVRDMNSDDVETAVYLSRKREEFKAELMEILGIVEEGY